MEVTTAWVVPPPPKQGLDHLGTQEPCIAYYSQLLPGVTNVTNRARYYSLYPWLLWAIDTHYPKADLSTYIDLFRRSDCLLTLVAERHARRLDESNDIHGATMTGREKLVPALGSLGKKEHLLLSRFATREKTQERYFQSTLGGLDQYYLGSLQELQILDAGTGPWLKYTRQRGEIVARAVDRAVDADLFFRTVDKDDVSIAILDQLSSFCFCNLIRSDDEHKFLVDLFFDRKNEHDVKGVQRRRTLALLLSLVDFASKQRPTWVDVGFTRGALYGRTVAGNAWKVPPSFESTAEAWQVYERNDLLSTAMQAMFAVVLRVLEDSPVPHLSAQQFAQWFLELPGLKACVADLGAPSFRGAIRQVAKTLPRQTDWENPAHEFQISTAMLTEYGGGSDRRVLWPVFGKALRVMLALTYRTRAEGPEYAFSPFPSDFLRDHPINLESFRRNSLGTWQGMTVRDLVGWLVSEWGINTHLRVALRKLRSNPQATFRVRPSERGLQVMEGIPPPAPTNPRLRQGLQILRDIGAIEYDETLQSTRLTDLGQHLLGEASAN